MLKPATPIAVPESVRPRVWWTIFGPLVVVVGALTVAVAVAVVMAAVGSGDAAAEAVAAFLASLAIVAGGLLLLWLLPRDARERHEAIGVRHTPLGAVGNGVAIGIGALIVAGSLMAAGQLVDTPFERSVDDLDQGVGDTFWQVALTVLAVVVLAPIGEELLFRAFLFRGLSLRLPFVWAALISAATFSMFHFDLYIIGWPRGLGLLATGLLLAWIYRWRGYPAAVVTHATVNLAAAIALVASA